MNPAAKRLLWPVIAGGATLLLTLYWRDFPPRLAILSALLVAALSYSSIQGSQRLRHLFRRDP